MLSLAGLSDLFCTSTPHTRNCRSYIAASAAESSPMLIKTLPAARSSCRQAAQYKRHRLRAGKSYRVRYEMCCKKQQASIRERYYH